MNNNRYSYFRIEYDDDWEDFDFTKKTFSYPFNGTNINYVSESVNWASPGTEFAYNINYIETAEFSGNTFVYTSSDLFEDSLLSKTDATYTYKLPDIPRIATDDYSTWELVKYDFDGITKRLSGLTVDSDYYVSDTPWALSTTAGTNSYLFGLSKNTNSLLLTPRDLIVTWSDHIAFNSTTINIDTNLDDTYRKQKEVYIKYWGTYNVSFDTRYTQSCNGTRAKIYVNWIPVWTARDGSSTNEDITLNSWDLIQLYTRKGCNWTTEVKNFKWEYSIKKYPNTKSYWNIILE